MASTRRVSARPLELYVGAPHTIRHALKEFKLLGYRNRKDLSKPGSYNVSKPVIAVYKRGFDFRDGTEDEQLLHIYFDRSGLSEVISPDRQVIVWYVSYPLCTGGISPKQAEDRIPVYSRSTTQC